MTMSKLEQAFKASNTRDLANALRLEHKDVLEAYGVMYVRLQPSYRKFYMPMAAVDLDGPYAKDMPKMFIYKMIDMLFENGKLKSL